MAALHASTISDISHSILRLPPSLTVERKNGLHFRLYSVNCLLLVIVVLSAQFSASTLFITAYVTSSPLLKYKHPSTDVRDSQLESATTATRLHSSWSRQGTPTGSSGRAFGVRQRVRDVLEKAKSRTGVNNVNSESPSSIPVPNKSIGYGTTSTSRQSAMISSSFSLNDYEYIMNEFRDGLVDSTVNNIDQVKTQVKTVLSQAKNEYTYGSSNTASKQASDEVNSMSSNSSVKPLPFVLPDLTDEQKQMLARGQRVEEQAAMSMEGSGFVVMDIPAPDYVIWEALLDFEAYPENISTVKRMQIFTNKHLKQSYIAEKPISSGRETRHYGTPCITRASFVISKFNFNIAAIHKYVPHPDGHYMEFSLDKACKNAVLQDAKGIWYTQSVRDEVTGQDCTRLWLLCELHVSNLLPQMIVDYAAGKAMPRATAWIMPAVERLRKEFRLDESNNFLA